MRPASSWCPTHGQVTQMCRLLEVRPDRDDRTLIAGFPEADRESPIRNGKVMRMSYGSLVCLEHLTL